MGGFREMKLKRYSIAKTKIDGKIKKNAVLNRKSKR